MVCCEDNDEVNELVKAEGEVMVSKGRAWRAPERRRTRRGEEGKERDEGGCKFSSVCDEI